MFWRRQQSPIDGMTFSCKQDIEKGSERVKLEEPVDALHFPRTALNPKTRFALIGLVFRFHPP